MRTAPKLSLLAMALLLAVGPASATDLMAVYERARSSDPQLQTAEAQRLAQREGCRRRAPTCCRTSAARPR